MTRIRPRALRGLVAAGLAGALALSMLVTAGASSHRESPFILEDPVADNTDVYAFVSPDKPNMTTLIANVNPLEVPGGGPNYYKFGDDVKYEINVDNNGDAIDDIVYEFRFRTEIVNGDAPLAYLGEITSLNDPDYNLRQYYTLTEVRNGRRKVLGRNLAVPPNNVGPRSSGVPYNRLARMAIHKVGNGMKVFAGQREDPFYVDIAAIGDVGGLRPFNTAHVIPVRPVTAGKDTLGKMNVHTMALQIPTAHLVESEDQPVIGVYSTTYRRARRLFANNDGSRPVSAGPWVQVSRLGNPLVNEVIIPLKDKDRFNASEPRNDAQFLKYVRNPAIAAGIQQLYPVFDCFPDAPRTDLVTVFLTGIPGLNMVEGGTPHEALRLNTSIPPTPPAKQDRLGLLAGQLDGFPNGRRLIDDVTDIELRVLAGASPLGTCEGESPNNILGDAVSFNDKPRFFRNKNLPQLRRFPYVVDPFQGFADELHKVQSRALPLKPADQ